MSLSDNISLLNKLYTPREVFPLGTILVAAFDAAVSTLVLLALFPIEHYTPTRQSFYVPIMLLILVAFTAVVTLAISAVVVYMRDLRIALPLVIQLGLFLTPVAYGASAIVKSRTSLIVYSAVNPLVPVIDGLRRTMLLGQSPDWTLELVGAARLRVGPRWRLLLVQASRDGTRRRCVTAPSPRRSPGSASGTITGRTTSQDQLGRVADQGPRQESAGWRWVLRDIEFRADPGESWALVGANGAGKSTLLKILTRVMYPTAGRVEVAGRVGALIEIRAGIAPLLTGRENIYLTGILMGMKRKEIARRFDDIVEFAGLETSVDRQVKYYSTGMQMRLGFRSRRVSRAGCAAGRRGAGGRGCLVPAALPRTDAKGARTGHDTRARLPRSRCDRGNVRERRLARTTAPCKLPAPCARCSATYRRSVEGAAVQRQPTGSCDSASWRSARRPVPGYDTGGPLDISFVLESDEEYRAWIYLGISEGAATPIFLINPGREAPIEPGMTRISCAVERMPLPRGRYYLWGAAYRDWTNGPDSLAGSRWPSSMSTGRSSMPSTRNRAPFPGARRFDVVFRAGCGRVAFVFGPVVYVRPSERRDRLPPSTSGWSNRGCSP